MTKDGAYTDANPYLTKNERVLDETSNLIVTDEKILVKSSEGFVPVDYPEIEKAVHRPEQLKTISILSYFISSVFLILLSVFAIFTREINIIIAIAALPTFMVYTFFFIHEKNSGNLVRESETRLVLENGNDISLNSEEFFESAYENIVENTDSEN